MPVQAEELSVIGARMPIWHQTRSVDADLVLEALNLPLRERLRRRFWCS